jgi:hypothetical protein
MDLLLALDPSEIHRAQGMYLDPWQQLLLAEDRGTMLCYCSGVGKSRTTSVKALHRAHGVRPLRQEFPGDRE